MKPSLLMLMYSSYRLIKSIPFAIRHPRYWQKFVFADLYWTQALYKNIKRTVFNYRQPKYTPPCSVNQEALISLKQNGYALITIPSLNTLFAELNELLSNQLDLCCVSEKNGIGRFKSVKKDFLQSFRISPSENSCMRQISENPILLDILKSYYEEQFYLLESSLWFSPNKTFEGRSQLFHMDHESLSTIKLFIALEHVNMTSGPLTVIPRQQSQLLFRRLIKQGHVRRRNQKITDALVEQILGKCIDKVSVPLTLDKYQIAIVDTSKCYHYGSRPATCGMRSERRLINLIYVPWHSPELPFAPTRNGIDLNTVTSMTKLGFSSKYLY